MSDHLLTDGGLLLTEDDHALILDTGRPRPDEPVPPAFDLIAPVLGDLQAALPHWWAKGDEAE